MANVEMTLKAPPMQGKRVREDLTGKRFGRWTVMELHPVRSKSGRARWVCRCDCGNQGVVEALNLKQGGSNSCGCYNKDKTSEANSTHNMSSRAEYSPWKAMRMRCNNPNNANYDRYGGRGIKVCDRWNDFSAFLEDMGPRPTPDHTIERRDNDGDYEPGNCFWATRLEQAHNTSRSIILPDGRVLATLVRESGLKPWVVRDRLARGLSVEEALSNSDRAEF